ncbi:MAG: FG-GAP repeat protein, partial [Planctomycetota bacterium]
MFRLSIVRTFVAVAVAIVLGTTPAWALTAEQEAKLLPADGAAGDIFGVIVALDGDTAIIGAVYDDDNGEDSGSAYVFTRTAGVWTQQAKLLASDGASQDWFGSVALEGDTAIIGASGDDDNGEDSGSAYVFTRAAGVWTEQAKLLASDGAAFDGFSYLVALDGDTAVIAPWRDDDNGVNSGSAYVFTRTGGVWTEQAKLLASDGAADDYFGRSVALEGDTAIIGAAGDDYIGYLS